jgi:hypothetical protein
LHVFNLAATTDRASVVKLHELDCEEREFVTAAPSLGLSARQLHRA